MIGILRPGKVQLYVRSMGKALKVTAIALSEEAANLYCQQHDEAAVVAQIGPNGNALILLADKYDPGIQIPKEERK